MAGSLHPSSPFIVGFWKLHTLRDFFRNLLWCSINWRNLNTLVYEAFEVKAFIHHSDCVHLRGAFNGLVLKWLFINRVELWNLLMRCLIEAFLVVRSYTSQNGINLRPGARNRGHALFVFVHEQYRVLSVVTLLLLYFRFWQFQSRLFIANWVSGTILLQDGFESTRFDWWGPKQISRSHLGSGLWPQVKITQICFLLFNIGNRRLLRRYRIL